MSSYSFWNNKGGVGKSFLCFVAAAEYAHRNPETDVFVIDLCPQGNVSEILLGGVTTGVAVDSSSPQAATRARSTTRPGIDSSSLTMTSPFKTERPRS